MELVSSYCGTLSLYNDTDPVKAENMRIGNMFVKPGSPGHAMLIVDMAVNRFGEKIFMLAQGYMPAQDIHIVKNPVEPGLGPWYRLKKGVRLVTPEWIFDWNDLKSWPK